MFNETVHSVFVWVHSSWASFALPYCCRLNGLHRVHGLRVPKPLSRCSLTFLDSFFSESVVFVFSPLCFSFFPPCVLFTF